MKRLLLAAILVSSPLVYTGCSTQTPAAITYRTLGTTINTVDLGMKVWAHSWNQRRTAAQGNDNKLIELNNELSLVSAAKDKYNLAMSLAFGTIEVAMSTDPKTITPPNVDNAANALLTIIRK